MECQTGYNATNGNSARTCLETGQWNGTNITCTGIGTFKLGLTVMNSRVFRLKILYEYQCASVSCNIIVTGLDWYFKIC